MAYLSIYRKYRPDTFDSVIGQEHIVRILSNQVKTDTISHAYLFTGTRGTGKTSVAKIFAKAINCSNNVNGNSCKVCPVCKELAMPNNLDIIEMDAASNNGVDDIRDIRETVKYAPTLGKYKVYIIDEAHMLTTGAFNALLKTLEEPPAHAVFILATTEAHKIPETILSRCMRFDFRLVSTEKLAERIKLIYDDLGITYEDSAIKAIAEAGDGSVRDALSIADMCLSYGEGNVTYNDTLEVLGASSPAKILEIVGAMMQSNVKVAFTIVEELMALGKSVLALSRDITKMLRNLYLAKSCGRDNNLLVLPEDVITRLILIAAKTESTRIINTIDLFSALEGDMRYSRMPRIILESAIAKASEITAQINVNGLLTRIKALESGQISQVGQVASPSVASEKVTEVAKRNFNAMEALGLLIKALDTERKLIARQLANGLDDRNFTLTDGVMQVGVDNDNMLDSLIKENCADLFCKIWDRYYNVSKVEFFPIKNKRDISNDIETVKNLLGSKWVKVIK